MTQARGQQVADKILESADKLFYRQGYNATGINQIVEEAGVAKASLYQHFDSKTDLLVGCIEMNHQGWYQRLKTHLSAVEDPKEKLLAIFDYYIGRQTTREHGGCPFIKANDEAGVTEPRVLEQIQKVKQQSREMIGQLVAASGHKKILSDDALAELIFLSIEGGTAAASVFKNTADLEAAKQIIKKLI
jgi:AcrR family transcriptional regulator